jgi:hypothetical protein
VIFDDAEFQIAIEKARAMKAEIQKCKACSVLAMEDVPIREAQTRMPALVAALVRKYGSKLTDMPGHQRQLLRRRLGRSPVSAGNIRRRSTVRRRSGRWRCVGIRPHP